MKKIILTLVIIYLILIIIFEGYYRLYPSIPIYPNNYHDLVIMKKEMNNRNKKDIDFLKQINQLFMHFYLL